MRILGVYVCLLIIGLCCAVSWGLNPINVSYLVTMLSMLLLLLFRAAFCHCWDKTTFLEMLLSHVAIITNANTGTLQWQYYFYIYTSSGECCRWCRSTRGRSYSGWGGCSVAAPRGQVRTLNIGCSFKLLRIEYIPNHIMYCILQLGKISCPINPNIDLVFCCCEYRLVIIMIGYPVWKQNSESAYCFSGLTTNLGDHF